MDSFLALSRLFARRIFLPVVALTAIAFASCDSSSGDSATPTPATVVPVVFVGDSVTWGAYASTKENMFPRLLWADLQAIGVQGPNKTIWTMTPPDDLAAIRKAVNGERKIIIVEIGVHWGYELDETQFRETFPAALDCLAGSGAIVVVGTIPWLAWEPGSEMYAKMELFSRIIREEAAKRAIAVADLWTATADRPETISVPGEPCFWAPGCAGDGFHPGDIGHATIADAYYKALVPLLAAPPKAGYVDRCDFDGYIASLPKK